MGSAEQWLAKKPQDLSGSYGIAVSLNLIYVPPGCAKEIERMCAFAAAPSARPPVWPSEAVGPGRRPSQAKRPLRHWATAAARNAPTATRCRSDRPVRGRRLPAYLCGLPSVAMSFIKAPKFVHQARASPARVAQCHASAAQCQAQASWPCVLCRPSVPRVRAHVYPCLLAASLCVRACIEEDREGEYPLSYLRFVQNLFDLNAMAQNQFYNK